MFIIMKRPWSEIAYFYTFGFLSIELSMTLCKLNKWKRWTIWDNLFYSCLFVGNRGGKYVLLTRTENIVVVYLLKHTNTHYGEQPTGKHLNHIKLLFTIFGSEIASTVYPRHHCHCSLSRFYNRTHFLCHKGW